MEKRAVTQRKARKSARGRKRVTRERDTLPKILGAAMGLLQRQGFDGTTLDEILQVAGVTKGAFFYYFKSKEDLGYAVMKQFVEMDQDIARQLAERAEKLTRDPLEQLLLMVGLLAEMFEGLTEPHPGCLIASYCYQKELMTPPLRALASETLIKWRALVLGKLKAAAAARKPVFAVDLEAVADLLNTIVEGAFVMSKTLDDPQLIARQIGHYRAYLELLFGRNPTSAKRAQA